LDTGRSSSAPTITVEVRRTGQTYVKTPASEFDHAILDFVRVLFNNKRAAIGQRDNRIRVQLDMFDEIRIYKDVTLVEPG
jgi:hypothetical protein